MTDAELASIEEWFAHTTTPCGNDVCVGEWGAVNGPLLIAEVKRRGALLRRHGIDPQSEVMPRWGNAYSAPSTWGVDEAGTLRMRVIGEE